MLKRMRQDFKKYSWTLWLVIIFFVGGFILTDLFTEGSVGKNDVVVVGKQKVKGADFQKQLKMTLSRYNQQFNNKLNKNFIQQLQIPSQSLNTLINSVVIQMEADEYNLEVSDEEVAEGIKKSFSQNGQFIGKERYEGLVRRNNMRIVEFEEDFKKDLKTNKLKEILTSGLSINDDELYKKYIQEKEKAEVEYITVTTEYIKTDPKITEGEIKDFYDKNKEQYKSPQKRKGDIVLLKYSDYKKDIQITEREIGEYFLNNKDQFRVKGKIKVSRIFLRFTEGNREDVDKKADQVKARLEQITDTRERLEEFAKVAEEISQDENAKKGGDYGYTDWQRLNEHEVSTINKLTMGQISNIIGTEGGFSILCLTEKIPSRTKPLDEVRSLIKETLTGDRVNSYVLKKANALYSRVENKEDLKPIAEEMGLTVTSTDFVESRAGIQDIDMTGKIASVFFALDKKEISNPIEFYRGVAIVQLKEILESEQLALDVVKDQIKITLIKNKKIKLLDKEVEDLYGEIIKRKDQETLKKYLEKKNLNLAAITYKPGDRFLSYSRYQGLDKLILNIDTLLDDFLVPVRMDDDFVFIKIKSREIVDKDDFLKDKVDFCKKKLDQLKNDYFVSLMLMKRNKYKISFNKKLYDEIVEYELNRFK